MLDLARLKKVRLSRVPWGHLAVAHLLLRWNYSIPKTELVVEGLENLPDRPSMLGMNHTDMYNYFPLQYLFYLNKRPFTATWVKGKYYHNPFVSFFLECTNNIPLPSRGYLLTHDFRRAAGRRPGDSEYRAIRDALDSGDPSELPPELGQGYLERFEERWEAMVGEIDRLNREALFEHKTNVLVFPQGTRSRRLSEGHTGIAQTALHLKVPIVPIGCSGSDRVYPDSYPISRGGRIVYRIGKPLEPDSPELAPYLIDEPFMPLTRGAARQHGERFRAVTDLLMDHINELVDEPYRYAPDRRSQGVKGVDRFM